MLWPLLLILGVGIWWQLSDQPTHQAGRRVYVQHCAHCHMEDGQGLKKLIPPLAGADYLASMRMEDLACMIRYGVRDSMQVNGIWFDQAMPGNLLLTEVEITSLVNFLRENWVEPPQVPIDFSQVQQALADCPGKP